MFNRLLTYTAMSAAVVLTFSIQMTQSSNSTVADRAKANKIVEVSFQNQGFLQENDAYGKGEVRD